MIYFLIFFIILFTPNNKRFSIFLGGSLLFLLAACRYMVGYDYENYLNIILGSEDAFEFTRLELTSFKLICLSKHLDFPQLYFIVTSFFIIITFSYVIYKESPSVKLSLILFYSLPVFFLSSLSIVRQMWACGFIFIAMYMWQRKNYIGYVLFLILAMQTHISSCVGILIPLASIGVKNKYYYLVAFLFSISVALFFKDFLISMVLKVNIDNAIFIKAKDFILEKTDLRGYKSTLYLFNFIYLVVWLFYYKYLINYNKSFSFYFNIISMGTFIMNCFSIFGVLGGRISIYFLTPWLLLIPAIVFIPNIEFIKLKKIIYSTCCFLLFSYTLYLSHHCYAIGITEKDSYFPYQTFWEQH